MEYTIIVPEVQVLHEMPILPIATGKKQKMSKTAHSV
jgi:hypothetical protein